MASRKRRNFGRDCKLKHVASLVTHAVQSVATVTEKRPYRPEAARADLSVADNGDRRTNSDSNMVEGRFRQRQLLTHVVHVREVSLIFDIF